METSTTDPQTKVPHRAVARASGEDFGTLDLFEQSNRINLSVLSLAPRQVFVVRQPDNQVLHRYQVSRYDQVLELALRDAILSQDPGRSRFGRVSENFARSEVEAQSPVAPGEVQRHVGSRLAVQHQADSETSRVPEGLEERFAWLAVLRNVQRGPGEALRVREEHAAHHAVVGDAEPPLRLGIKLGRPAKPTLEVTSAAAVARIPTDRRQGKVRHRPRHHALSDHPEGDHVARG